MFEVLIVVGLVVASGLLASRMTEGEFTMTNDTSGGTGPTGWTAESWRSVITPLAESRNLNVDFCIAWIKEESGGNPCSIGSVGAVGPDKNPREIGIAQLYNPDDFAALGINADKLRSYCSGNSQACTRPLRDDEMSYHAAAAIALMSKCRDKAFSYLSSHGVEWSEHDRYCMVKLWHGLPGLVSSGLGKVSQTLGRSPISWDEYKATIDITTLDNGTESYRSQFDRIFTNAERAAAEV